MKKPGKILYTNKKHSYPGIFATVLASIVLITLIVLIIVSYKTAGNNPDNFGATLLLCTVFSLSGLILGLIGKYQADRFLLWSHVGLIMNAIDLAAIGMILYAGI